MSRYTSFDDFMVDVVDTANKTTRLENLFDLRSQEVVGIVLKILMKGWLVFVSVAVILSLSIFAFWGALITFSVSPPGMLVLAIFGAALYGSMKTLYMSRQLPLAIKKVGDVYQEKHNNVRSKFDQNNEILFDEIDHLLFAAVEELISLAKDEAEKAKAIMLVVATEAAYKAQKKMIKRGVVRAGIAVLTQQSENPAVDLLSDWTAAIQESGEA